MRAALRPVRTPLCHRRALLALFLLVAPGCGAPPPEVDLVGRVESPSGAPMSGVLVHAGGSLTTSATDGTFEIPGVAVPYTLTVASTVGDPWVHAFAGLTSAAPLVVPQQYELPLLEATIAGDVWGGLAVPDGHAVSVCVEGRDFVVWGCRLADEGDVTYSVGLRWSGATTAHVRVHALYMTVDGGGLPTGYTGLRHLDATVSHGSTMDLDLSQNLLLGSGPTVPITIDAGAGTVVLAVVAVRIADRLAQTVRAGPWPGGTVDLALPPAAIASGYQVTACVQFPSGLVAYVWGVAGAGEALDLVAPAPPQQIEPAPGATGVTADTVFRAVGGGAAARQFYWSPSGATDGPRVRLTTRDQTARLPDVSAFGLAYPAGGAYEWVAVDVVAADYEAAVAFPFDLMQLYGGGGGGPTVGGAVVQSEAREFALAP
jgi:hypothetical protein